MGKLYGPELKYKGAGKGDRRRPMFISQEQYAKNYERIFGKKKNGTGNNRQAERKN